MTSTTTNCTPPFQAQFHEKRREPRALLTLQIEVSGFNRAGRFFTELTTTHDISDHGCGFGLHTEVNKDSVVGIRVMRQPISESCDARRVLFQVAHVEHKAEGWSLGAAKLDQDRQWSVECLM